MTIKATEVGRDVYVATTFDLSGNTELGLKFTSPSGIETDILSTRITAPATASPSTPEEGIMPASTYMTFSTLATDFTEAGTWTVCATYIDATPKTYYGDPSTFTVEAAC